MVPGKARSEAVETCPMRVTPYPACFQVEATVDGVNREAADRNPVVPVLRSALEKDCKEEIGGADRDRTGDPLLAKQVLSQLSYSPLLGANG